MNTIIEKIRAEVLRLIRESDGPGSQYGFGMMSACNRILKILDTIQEQPVCEDLETEALRSGGVILSEHFEDEDDDAIRTTALRCWKGGFIAGASWQKEQMLKEAVETWMLEGSMFEPEFFKRKVIVIKED